LPDGSKVNKKGIEYYQKIIDGCLERGIEPIVTIFHWDLPQYLQDLGGLTNPIFVDYYLAYADILFNAFGDKVSCAISIRNENFRL
jgi:beta-glucosidase